MNLPEGDSKFLQTMWLSSENSWRFLGILGDSEELCKKRTRSVVPLDEGNIYARMIFRISKTVKSTIWKSGI